MGGKIFSSFLIVVVAAILFMIPFTQMAYDFRTDPRTDSFLTTTALGVTTANETLLEDLFDDDIGSVDIVSGNVSTDAPIATSYNATNRLIFFSGMTGNATRLLHITYDVDALNEVPAINTLVDRMAMIWLLVAVAFAPAAIFAIFTGRA